MSVTAQALYNHTGSGYDMSNRCLETGPEDSHRRCGSDMFRQTVPDTSSGDRKSSVADGRQSGAADDQ